MEAIASNKFANPANIPDVIGFEGHPVRYVLREGRPWIVARDLAAPLGLTIRSLLKSVAKLSKRHIGELEVHRTNVPKRRMQVLSKDGVLKIVAQTRGPIGQRLVDRITSLAAKYDDGELVLRGAQALALPASAEARIVALEGALAQLVAGIHQFNRLPMTDLPEILRPERPVGILSLAWVEEFLQACDGYWFGSVSHLADLLGVKPSVLNSFLREKAGFAGKLWVEIGTRGHRKYCSLSLQPN